MLNLLIGISIVSYITMMVHAVMVGRACARLLPPEVPVLRWSTIGAGQNIVLAAIFSVTTFPTSPLVVLWQIKSQTLDKIQRATIFALAVKQGFVPYEEARRLWASFGDEESYWKAHFK